MSLHHKSFFFFLLSKRHCEILMDGAGFHHLDKGLGPIQRIDSNSDMLTVYIHVKLN